MRTSAQTVGQAPPNAEAPKVVIASSVAAGHTRTLEHAGEATRAALTGGFQQALWVLGGIALLALPAIFALGRDREVKGGEAKVVIREVPAALAATN